MKFWTGVTDNDWYSFLSERKLDEVNFWRPSPGPYFTNLQAGTPFLFKLKAPFNHIAGGGFFAQYSTLPIEMVWDAFGEKNGAASFREFDQKNRAHRKLPKGHLEMGLRRVPRRRPCGRLGSFPSGGARSRLASTLAIHIQPPSWLQPLSPSGSNTRLNAMCF